MKWIFILYLKKLKVTILWLQNLLLVMRKYPQVLIPAIGNRNVLCNLKQQYNENDIKNFSTWNITNDVQRL